MKSLPFALMLSFLISLSACYQRRDLPVTPQLEFVSMNKDTLLQGFSKEDSLIIILDLTDGDGDIGFSESDTIINSIHIVDQRTGNVSEQFNIPKIPENISVNGIEARIELTLYTTCCLFPENIPPCSVSDEYPLDTLVYEIQIRDRAGNFSEGVSTPPILLLCNK